MAIFSFSKCDRLRKRHEYLSLSEYGKKISNKQFIALLVPSSTDRNRLGVTCTKKVGCAVVRNSLKRCCREYFRLNRHQIMGEWDICLIAKKLASEASREQVFLSLKDIFDRITRNVSK
jgi:ribonuclease P protein component